MRSIHTLALLGSVTLAACAPTEADKPTDTATDTSTATQTGSGTSTGSATQTDTDTSTGSGTSTGTGGLVDADGDGVPADEDCDDADARSTVVAEDADCDGALTVDECDEEDPLSTLLAEDGDCDGVLTADDCDDDDNASTVVAGDADCDGVITALDCDDTDASVHPGMAHEAPDVCGPDGDGDGYVHVDWGGTDCYDADVTVHPGAAYNEPERCTYDQDGDGWGDHYFNGSDCDDGDRSVVPQPETCNGLDDDCDGATDEIDEDADGVTLCAGDCADDDASRFPGNPEQCDGIDNDCDATTDENVDGDGDGYTLCDNDCDDGRATVNPGGVDGGAHGDVCDGLDNDCDGLVDETATCQGCQEMLEYDASYLNCTLSHDWDDARTYCQALGGDLASAESLGESMFIRNMSREGASWVGAYYSSSAGWTLVSGGVYRFGYNEPPRYDNARLLAHPDFIDQMSGDDVRDFTCERPDHAADADGDGYIAEGRGGTDCNESDAYVHPDVAGRVCGLDADADGEVRRTDGGRDCDDTDPASYTTDVDADCDGLPVELDVMELIAAGSFDMGCTPGQASCDSYEYPIMPVTLTRAFYVGRTEVTQAEYEALMGYNPSYFACPSGDCPVERVSWHEAAAYANAASASAGLTSCYACVGTGTDVVCSSSSNPYACTGYRLPTEAEWEYAARCGTDLRYAGSDDLSAVAWWYNNAYDGSYPGPRPHGVGQLSANACGVYDMSGNVSEWVEDHWDPVLYSADGRTNPLGVSLDELHAYRGGFAWSLEPGARVARRDAAGSSERYEMLGFRLARTAP